MILYEFAGPFLTGLGGSHWDGYQQLQAEAPAGLGPFLGIWMSDMVWRLVLGARVAFLAYNCSARGSASQ